MKRRSRRTFIKNAAATAAGGVLLGTGTSGIVEAASQDRVAGANRRPRVALIGCGGMGTTDLRAALRLGAQCVALCDVDDEQVRKVGERVKTEFDQTPALTTRDFRRVLDRQDVDGVIIATPGRWHALPA